MKSNGCIRTFGPASKAMRKVQKDRTREIIRDHERKAEKKEMEELQEGQRKKMRDVVNYFHEMFPNAMADEKKLEMPFKHGTKSQFGMVVYIDSLGNFPGWREAAMEYFNIKIGL